MQNLGLPSFSTLLLDHMLYQVFGYTSVSVVEPYGHLLTEVFEPQSAFIDQWVILM